MVDDKAGFSQKPNPHASVSIGFVCLFLALPDHLGYRSIPVGSPLPEPPFIVPTPGYFQQLTKALNRVSVPEAMNDPKLYSFASHPSHASRKERSITLPVFYSKVSCFSLSTF